MDSAPTRPKDKASEDLTIEITKTVVNSINGKMFPNSSLLDKVDPNFLKWNFRTRERIAPTAKFNRSEPIDNGADSVSEIFSSIIRLRFLYLYYI